MKIDYVISYIDYSQKEIRDLYEQVANKKCVMDHNKSYIDFELVLKLILSKLSFINKLYIVCKDIQVLPNKVEKLINKENGRIVRINESQILPKNFITFSSACIEMFIWKIPGLSKYFIYGCDDMIPIKPLTPNNFYNENNQPKISFIYVDYPFNNLFALHTLNAYNLIYDRSNNNDDYNVRLRTAHTVRPLTKSICKQCYKEYKSFIKGSLYKIRYFNNFNMDLYMLYGLKNNLIENKSGFNALYYFITDKNSIIDILEKIDNRKYDELPDIICINDHLDNEIDNNELSLIYDNIKYLCLKMLHY